MKYVSTSGAAKTATLSEAIERGLAPDGGLYVPQMFPELLTEQLQGVTELPEVAESLLAPFFAGDFLASHLRSICRSAFDFPIRLKDLKDDTAVLELFHGPTAAFKDFGARFLAECLSRIVLRRPDPLTLLVATSGDTGGAVAAAFHGKHSIEVAVLYPEGMISPRQERQLTTLGGNIKALSVAGDFDDCQRLVKEAMADPGLRAARRLSSANSINIGRLLPQAAYYTWASLEYRRRHGHDAGYIIPSGNLGNASAALWARRMGGGTHDIILATNANRSVSAFMSGTAWQAYPTISTFATAMDVGSPSNIERIFHLFGGEAHARRSLRTYQVSDAEISEVIARGLVDWGEIWDPHTATAVAAREQLGTRHWIVVATAHPAKFESLVEPLIGRAVPVPDCLMEILNRPTKSIRIPPRLPALVEALG